MASVLPTVALSSTNIFSFLAFSHGSSKVILAIPAATSIFEASLLCPHIGLPLAATYAVTKMGILASLGGLV